MTPPVKTYEKTESLPFAVILLSGDGRILYRNRMAKGLLPPLSGMKEFISEKREMLSEGGFFFASLNGRRYCVFSSHEETPCRRVFFFEEFARLFHPVADELLERGEALFRDYEERLLSDGIAEERGGARASYLKRLSLRSRRFREEQRAYLRLVKATRRRKGEKEAWDLGDFFDEFGRVMVGLGFAVESSLPPETVIKFHWDTLSEILLNLLSFAALYEGERTIGIQGEKREDRLILRVLFFDREDLFRRFGNFLQDEEKRAHTKKSLSRFMPFSSLFTAALICEGEGLLFSVDRVKENCRITLSLPVTEDKAVRFLSALDPETRRRLVQKAKEFFR